MSLIMLSVLMQIVLMLIGTVTIILIVVMLSVVMMNAVILSVVAPSFWLTDWLSCIKIICYCFVWWKKSLYLHPQLLIENHLADWHLADPQNVKSDFQSINCRWYWRVDPSWCCQIGATTLSIITLSVNRLFATLSITIHYVKCHYAECRVLFIAMLNVMFCLLLCWMLWCWVMSCPVWWRRQNVSRPNDFWPKDVQPPIFQEEL